MVGNHAREGEHRDSRKDEPDPKSRIQSVIMTVDASLDIGIGDASQMSSAGNGGMFVSRRN